MQNPPEGWRPQGWTPTASETSQRAGHDYTLGEALRTWQWYALWLLLFLNTLAGISIISQEAPIFQQLIGVSAIVAASMVGVASIGNAFGRVFWAWVSDLITRRATFFVMFVLQVLLFGSFQRHHRRSNDGCHVRHPDVLWGWLRHDAGICSGLFWLEECWANLRSDADGLGLCQCCWTRYDSVHARDNGFLPRRTSCDSGRDGDFNSGSHPRVATPNGFADSRKPVREPTHWVKGIIVVRGVRRRKEQRCPVRNSTVSY